MSAAVSEVLMKTSSQRNQASPAEGEEKDEQRLEVAHAAGAAKKRRGCVHPYFPAWRSTIPMVPGLQHCIPISEHIQPPEAYSRLTDSMTEL